MRKALGIFGIIAVLALFALAVIPTSAHPPSSMILEYQYEPQVLFVTVFHSVADPNTHYIEHVIINKNGLFEMERNYTSQTSASTFVDEFAILTNSGDVLQVTAICSISGQLTDQTTVTTGLNTQPPPAIPGFPCIATIIGITIAVGLASIRRRRRVIQ